ncbi:3-methyl-2-oxobutanoate hydroxymethyltransferase [Streptomyces sp. KK5PA1]|uniref:3-methyl-2-oxobutanoate hydroxymethyltransferase n=2 Tax=Actinacidiphila acididurans TaxID=2784346 RepID=A0ABS2TJV5_9ACTN|nr:3-methyl-2-oxobutanoate hydroxymethyltransferase [Actinacidiphila acididurans]
MTAPVTYPSQSARAASAAEARFRITRPIAPARNARVIALDEAAAAVARSVAGRSWAHARFYTCGPVPPGRPEELALSAVGEAPDVAPIALAAALEGTDVVMVLASEDSGGAQAAAIGGACWARAVTTAGVVLGDGFEADEAVAALRPYARVLLLSADEGDVVELLTALRV